MSSLLAPFPISSRNNEYQNNLNLRSFGLDAKDLEIDFDQKFHPYLVTQILHSCTFDADGKSLDQSFFWNLSVGKRIECLMIIATLGNQILSLILRCINLKCQKQMEIGLSIEDLTSLQNNTDEIDQLMFQLDNENLFVRKPTGLDQIEWLKISFVDEAGALEAMIQKLILNDKNKYAAHEILQKKETLLKINQAMEEFDPLVSFHIPIVCPYCKEENYYEIDLEDQALYSLREAQQNIIKTIHYVASKYHWNEQEVFSVPYWRLQKYLSLIKKGENF